MSWEEIRKANLKRIKSIKENYRRKLAMQKLLNPKVRRKGAPYAGIPTGHRQQRGRGANIPQALRQPVMNLPGWAGRRSGYGSRITSTGSGDIYLEAPGAHGPKRSNDIDTLFGRLGKELGYVEKVEKDEDGKLKIGDERMYATPLKSMTDFFDNANEKLGLKIPAKRFVGFMSNPRNQPLNIQNEEERWMRKLGWNTNDHALYRDFHLKLPDSDAVTTLSAIVDKIDGLEKEANKISIKDDVGENNADRLRRQMTLRKVERYKNRLKDEYDIDYKDIKPAFTSDKKIATRFPVKTIKKLPKRKYKNIQNVDELKDFLRDEIFIGASTSARKHELIDKSLTEKLSDPERKELNAIYENIKSSEENLLGRPGGATEIISELRNIKKRVKLLNMGNQKMPYSRIYNEIKDVLEANVYTYKGIPKKMMDEIIENIMVNDMGYEKPKKEKSDTASESDWRPPETNEQINQKINIAFDLFGDDELKNVKDNYKFEDGKWIFKNGNQKLTPQQMYMDNIVNELNDEEWDKVNEQYKKEQDNAEETDDDLSDDSDNIFDDIPDKTEEKKDEK